MPPYTIEMVSPGRKNVPRWLTFIASLVDIEPDCHTFVMVPRAGMPERTKVPEESFPSSSVGSSQISSPTTAYTESENIERRDQQPRTAEHEATNPSISIPASANAALAATEPDAMHPSIPSFSMTVMNTSIVDLGRSSRRTADNKACWI